MIVLCKKRGVKGYGQFGSTKDKIIKLLKGEIEYNDQRRSCNWSDTRKESFAESLNVKRLKNNLFDYLMKNNPLIIEQFVGNQDGLKIISYGTMINYKWKCKNYLKCLGIFEARP